MRVLFSVALISISACVSLPSRAAESGFGVYLLGSRGATGLGVVPPPGTYLSSETFFYKGTYQGPVSFAPGQLTQATLTVDLAFDLVTPIWVTKAKIAGGRLGFAATLPVGFVGVGLDVGASHVEDNRNVIGDPSVTAFIGWDRKDFHWDIGAAAYMATGPYDVQRLGNLSLNRPAVDTFVSATWLPFGLGIDISGSVGLTFNGENEATHYRTGTELHVEGAITKTLAKGFKLGAMAYHYEQLTADSGAGARVGPFKGRVTAVGALVGYDFTIEGTPVAARLQVVDEFNVKNRFKGTPVFLIVAIALP